VREGERFDTVYGELRERAFVRTECYQYDRLFRCRACGQHWLYQFWEWDDEDTALREDGHKECVVAAIERALASGLLLPHAHFHGGTR
jgi:hypothetical protein